MKLTLKRSFDEADSIYELFVSLEFLVAERRAITKHNLADYLVYPALPVSLAEVGHTLHFETAVEAATAEARIRSACAGLEPYLRDELGETAEHYFKDDPKDAPQEPTIAAEPPRPSTSTPEPFEWSKRIWNIVLVGGALLVGFWLIQAGYRMVSSVGPMPKVNGNRPNAVGAVVTDEAPPASLAPTCPPMRTGDRTVHYCTAGTEGSPRIEVALATSEHVCIKGHPLEHGVRILLTNDDGQEVAMGDGQVSHIVSWRFIPPRPATTVGYYASPGPGCSEEPVQCPMFSTQSASCELQPRLSEWIRTDPAAPNGLSECWEPGNRALFERVEYLDGNNEVHTYDFDHPPGSEAIHAWRFWPKKPLTLLYNLSSSPCPVG